MTVFHYPHCLLSFPFSQSLLFAPNYINVLGENQLLWEALYPTNEKGTRHRRVPFLSVYLLYIRINLQTRFEFNRQFFIIDWHLLNELPDKRFRVFGNRFCLFIRKRSEVITPYL